MALVAGVVLLSTLSLPTHVEVELGCDNSRPFVGPWKLNMWPYGPATYNLSILRWCPIFCIFVVSHLY